MQKYPPNTRGAVFQDRLLAGMRAEHGAPDAVIPCGQDLTRDDGRTESVPASHEAGHAK